MAKLCYLRDELGAPWTKRLSDLETPPTQLSYSGTLPSMHHCVAIVGTRRASESACQWTYKLARELAHAGVTVISGGAYGIDESAHRGALSSGACATVCVLGSGLAHAYGRRPKALHDSVLSGGALLSEYEDDVAPKRYMFLQRNRIIAAISHVVLVVQAPYKSGAMNTAAHAKTLGRPLLAVPSSPWQPRGEGTRLLLKQGASMCTSIDDVLDVLPAGLSSEVTEVRCPQELSLLYALVGSLTPVDELVLASGLSAQQVRHQLMELLLLGLVDEDAGRWSRC